MNTVSGKATQGYVHAARLLLTRKACLCGMGMLPSLIRVVAAQVLM